MHLQSPPDMVLEKNGSGSSLTVKDKKNDTANNYSLDVILKVMVSLTFSSK